MFLTPISLQLQMLNQWIDAATYSLANKPTGSVIIHQCHGTTQYYFKEDPNLHIRYMRKEELPLICDLIQKDYDQRFLRLAKKIQKELCSLQKHHACRSASFLYRPLGEVYNNLHPVKKTHVAPYVLPDDLYIEQWLNTPYDGGYFTSDQPEILTENGERVRSKSEKIIADKYALLGIPYLYEKPTLLKDLGTVYSDFTLLDIKERTTVIHEHFGLMQDQEYNTRALHKINCYERTGYQQGVTFLTTFESSDHVFDMKAFENVIRNRFDNVNEL